MKMRQSINRALKIILLSVILSLTQVSQLSAQLRMMVQGEVLDAKSGKPLKGVQVSDMESEYVILTSSDSDGAFLVSVSPEARLKFVAPNNTHDEIIAPVKGKNNIIIRLQERSISIDDVVISIKGSKKDVRVEKTDIEIRGDYFFLQTAFKIPFSLFKDYERFIFQPVIFDVTRDTLYNMRPVVVDGRDYEVLIDRQLEFDESADKLRQYRIKSKPSESANKVDIYPYADSIYIAPYDRENGFKSDCYLALAGLAPPFDYRDSTSIAKGTRNVLRFFEYKLHPMKLDGTIVKQISEIDDPTSDNCDEDLIPRPRLSPLSSKGVAKITFGVNKTEVDTSIPENAESLKKISSTMEMVRSNPNATLQSVSMIGYASPEGDLAKNQRLADQRTATIFKRIKREIDPRLVKFVDLSYKGVVQPWSGLIDIIEPDDPVLSEKIRKIIEKTKDDYKLSQQMIARLPEYARIIRPKYLPMLRKVEYTIDYSVLREYTQEEMEERFRQTLNGGLEDSTVMARYEYYKMICNITDRKHREEVEDQAIKAYPDFVWAANRIAIRNILKQKAKMNLLDSLVAEKKPERAIIFNQALSALQDHNTHAADSLIYCVPNRLGLEYPLAVISALNGDYATAYPTLSKEGGINEVLLLLGMKENKRAMDIMADKMQDPINQSDPKMMYLFGTCVNRLNDANLLGVATNFLNLAIMFEPKMEAYAQVDSDMALIYDMYVAQYKAPAPTAEGDTSAAAVAPVSGKESIWSKIAKITKLTNITKSKSPKTQKVKEPKAEKVKEPKAEKVAKVKEPKVEKVKEPKAEKVAKVKEPKVEKVKEPKAKKEEVEVADE